MHQDFKDFVEHYRGAKLNPSQLDRVYEAEVFDGEQAKQAGLVDEVGNLMRVLREEYSDCKAVLYPRPGRFGLDFA